MFVPLSALTAATKDDKPKQRERGARDPCEQLADVPGNANGLHKRCGPLGGGSGVARGDFNGDGVGDLAIGVPDENIGNAVDAGAVNVIFGSAANGLTAAGNQFITQDTPGVAGVPEDDDHFGLTLAAVNINGDTFSDLAIGTPWEDTDGVVDEGFVQIMLGSATGLVAGPFYDFQSMEGRRCGDFCKFGGALAWGDFNDDGLGDLAIGMPGYTRTRLVSVVVGGTTLTRTEVVAEGAIMVQFGDAPGAHRLIESPELRDRGFGWGLAAGDHNGDGYDDLAVASPFHDALFVPAAGQVYVFRGSATDGLGLFRTYTQDNAGGTPEADDQFGTSLAFGDFDGDGRDDLIVGAPYEKLGTHNNAGAISVFYGLPLFPIRINRTITQDNLSGVDAEAGDLFGHALAAGDFDGDGNDDLAIGAPGEDIGNPFVIPTYFPNAGLVHVLYGHDTVGAGGGGAEIWHQGTSGVPGANEIGDMFGYSLSAWNFGRSTQKDLAVGVPYEDVNGHSDAGWIIVLYGGTGGLSTTNIESWHQDNTGILDQVETNDRFGMSMY
jgi:hypothetical protein